jgi:hypothetical protein
MVQLIALFTTLLVEGLGMAAAAWLLPGWRGRWARAVVLALGLNLVSHTFFWYTLAAVPVRGETVILLAEFAVVAAEGAIYAVTVARPAWSAWPVSLLLNWSSWVLGSYVWRLV